MMDSKMSAAGLISIVANLVSFISFILWCIFYSCIITFQDFYSCFRHVFLLSSYLLLDTWKSLRHLSSKINVAEQDVTNSRPCPIIKIHDNGLKITRDDVEIVMEKLGLMKGHGPQEPLPDSFEIVTVFDRTEPSLDEVREAFGLFDENNDGFIDAEELKKVMSSLGLVGLSEQECQRMIMAFDDDGDGRIDFGEFVKLMEENGCC